MELDSLDRDFIRSGTLLYTGGEEDLRPHEGRSMSRQRRGGVSGRRDGTSQADWSSECGWSTPYTCMAAQCTHGPLRPLIRRGLSLNMTLMMVSTLLMSPLACVQIVGYTTKTQCRKFETDIPRKGIARPQYQFPHSCQVLILIEITDNSTFSN